MDKKMNTQVETRKNSRILAISVAFTLAAFGGHMVLTEKNADTLHKEMWDGGRKAAPGKPSMFYLTNVERGLMSITAKGGVYSTDENGNKLLCEYKGTNHHLFGRTLHTKTEVTNCRPPLAP